MRGPCKACGKVFRSWGAKIYCTIKCYHGSQEFREQMAEHSRRIAERLRRDAGAIDPTCPTVDISCLRCDKVRTVAFKARGRVFCGKPCQRKYYAERFDRWVANPDSLALPQCYDEFLVQEQLPCLVAGCSWVGKHLAQHANHVHGITAERLKELAGFNRTTALCVASVSESLSDRSGMGRTADFMRAIDPRVTGRYEGRPDARLENREHAAKAQALRANTVSPDRAPTACPECGKPVVQMVAGKNVYCSRKCRGKVYSRRQWRKDNPLVCRWCRRDFLGTRDQAKKVADGKPVFCSKSCASTWNRANTLKNR